MEKKEVNYMFANLHLIRGAVHCGRLFFYCTPRCTTRYPQSLVNADSVVFRVLSQNTHKHALSRINTLFYLRIIAYVILWLYYTLYVALVTND